MRSVCFYFTFFVISPSLSLSLYKRSCSCAEVSQPVTLLCPQLGCDPSGRSGGVAAHAALLARRLPNVRRQIDVSYPKPITCAPSAAGKRAYAEACEHVLLDAMHDALRTALVDDNTE